VLHELNSTPALADGTVPLEVFLTNAATLASPRVEATVFRDALTELMRRQ
jgi:hypothetical protein